MKIAPEALSQLSLLQAGQATERLRQLATGLGSGPQSAPFSGATPSAASSVLSLSPAVQQLVPASVPVQQWVQRLIEPLLPQMQNQGGDWSLSGQTRTQDGQPQHFTLQLSLPRPAGLSSPSPAAAPAGPQPSRLALGSTPPFPGQASEFTSSTLEGDAPPAHNIPARWLGLLLIHADAAISSQRPATLDPKSVTYGATLPLPNPAAVPHDAGVWLSAWGLRPPQATLDSTALTRSTELDELGQQGLGQPCQRQDCQHFELRSCPQAGCPLELASLPPLVQAPASDPGLAPGVHYHPIPTDPPIHDPNVIEVSTTPVAPKN